jgi:serine O-acetyltransferase
MYLSKLNHQFERLLHPGRNSIRLYRLAHVLHRKHVPFLPYLIQCINAFLHGCEIHYRAEIGKQFSVAHPHGVVIGRGVRIGDYCAVYSGVVLGVKVSGGDKQPELDHHVIVYAGAKIIGGVRVGENVGIGANAVVTHDIEPNSFAAGIPAQVIRNLDPLPDFSPRDEPDDSSGSHFDSDDISDSRTDGDETASRPSRSERRTEPQDELVSAATTAD